MPRIEPGHRIGLVLPAGGARAAYQVGVLKYIGENFTLTPRVLTGVSAGSINSCFLSQGEPFTQATQKLYELWSKLEYSQVMRVQFQSMMRLGVRILYDLFLSKFSKRRMLRSLIDATPLSLTLLEHIHFWKITRALRSGKLDGVAVTATNYSEGTATVFFDSRLPIQPWTRERRIAVRTSIRVRHIIASCSIPILFEPIKIGDYLYGDGSLRFNYPFSPALHLGATHILAISHRCESRVAPPPVAHNMGLGFIAGSVLNSLFQESLEFDYENICRINTREKNVDGQKLKVCFLRASRDLGDVAKDFYSEIPFHFRQVLGSTANKEDLGDLMSYLLFSPGYVNALMDLGYKDDKNQKDIIKQNLDL